MTKPSLISKGFAGLLKQAEEIESSKQQGTDEFRRSFFVDSEQLLTWMVKAKNLISLVCGENSEHYRQFSECAKGSPYGTNYSTFKSLRAVLIATKEDFEGGYLTKLRSLVQAEVFDSELDQARALLSAGYISPAAVIAGVVLETTLRQLCMDAAITLDKTSNKLDRMNAELAKAGVYNLLRQKRITALADLRNCAAHGRSEQFSADDVAGMIAEVESFITEHL